MAQPVERAWMISRVIMNNSTIIQRWDGDVHGIVRDGHFTLHALASDGEVPVFFLDPKGNRGATLYVSSESSGRSRSPFGSNRAGRQKPDWWTAHWQTIGEIPHRWRCVVHDGGHARSLPLREPT